MVHDRFILRLIKLKNKLISGRRLSIAYIRFVPGGAGLIWSRLKGYDLHLAE
jgi:hypothetical protein